MMKAPKYAALTMQQMIDGGINAFAMQLMAESHADKPDKFGDETVVLCAKAHNGTPVYMIMSTQPPDPSQFKSWPTSAPVGSAPPSDEGGSRPPSSSLLDRDAVIEEIAKWHDGNAALGAIGGSGGTPAQRRSYRANRDLHLSCAKYIRSLKSPTAAKE